jgi:hypothetical protein
MPGGIPQSRQTVARVSRRALRTSNVDEGWDKKDALITIKIRLEFPQKSICETAPPLCFFRLISADIGTPAKKITPNSAKKTRKNQGENVSTSGTLSSEEPGE